MDDTMEVRVHYSTQITARDTGSDEHPSQTGIRFASVVVGINELTTFVELRDKALELLAISPHEADMFSISAVYQWLDEDMNEKTEPCEYDSVWEAVLEDELAHVDCEVHLYLEGSGTRLSKRLKSETADQWTGTRSRPNPSSVSASTPLRGLAATTPHSHHRDDSSQGIGAGPSGSPPSPSPLHQLSSSSKPLKKVDGALTDFDQAAAFSGERKSNRATVRRPQWCQDPWLMTSSPTSVCDDRETIEDTLFAEALSMAYKVGTLETRFVQTNRAQSIGDSPWKETWCMLSPTFLAVCRPQTAQRGIKYVALTPACLKHMTVDNRQLTIVMPTSLPAIHEHKPQRSSTAHNAVNKNRAEEQAEGTTPTSVESASTPAATNVPEQQIPTHPAGDTGGFATAYKLCVKFPSLDELQVWLSALLEGPSLYTKDKREAQGLPVHMRRAWTHLHASHAMATAEATMAQASARETTHDEAELEKAADSFLGLVRNPALRRHFQTFLESEHASENFVFWSHTQHLKRMHMTRKNQTDLVQRRRWRRRGDIQARHIYDEFVAHTMENFEVACPQKIRSQIEIAVHQWPMPDDVYDALADHVMDEITRNQYVSFTRLRAYRTLLRSIPHQTSRIVRKREGLAWPGSTANGAIDQQAEDNENHGAREKSRPAAPNAAPNPVTSKSPSMVARASAVRSSLGGGGLSFLRAIPTPFGSRAARNGSMEGSWRVATNESMLSQKAVFGIDGLLNDPNLDSDPSPSTASLDASTEEVSGRASGRGAGSVKLGIGELCAHVAPSSPASLAFTLDENLEIVAMAQDANVEVVESNGIHSLYLGMRLVTFKGKALHTMEDLLQASKEYRSGDRSQAAGPMTFRRINRTVPFNPSTLGLTINEDLDVVSVVTDSQAATAGVELGWTVVAVDSKRVHTFSQLHALLQAARDEQEPEIKLTFIKTVHHFLCDGQCAHAMELDANLNFAKPVQINALTILRKGWRLLTVNGERLLSSFAARNVIKELAAAQASFRIQVSVDEDPELPTSLVSAREQPSAGKLPALNPLFLEDEWWGEGALQRASHASNPTSDTQEDTWVSTLPKTKSLMGRFGSLHALWDFNVLCHGSLQCWQDGLVVRPQTGGQADFDQMLADVKTDQLQSRYCVLVDTPVGMQFLVFYPESSVVRQCVALQEVTCVEPTKSTLFSLDISDCTGLCWRIQPDEEDEDANRSAYLTWYHHLKNGSQPTKSLRLIHEGLLSKRGLYNTALKKRWFQLLSDGDSNAVLRYFKSDTRELKGEIRDFTSVTLDSGSNLTIEAPGRTFNLAATSPKESAAWAEALRPLLKTGGNRGRARQSMMKRLRKTVMFRAGSK